MLILVTEIRDQSCTKLDDTRAVNAPEYRAA